MWRLPYPQFASYSPKRTLVISNWAPMSPSKSRQLHHLDPDQSQLRAALKQARNHYSPKKIIEAAGGATSEKAATSGQWVYTETALINFLRPTRPSTLEPKNYNHLAAFWLFTLLGRALRHPKVHEAPAFDQLMHRLATGQTSVPEYITNVSGLYFVCHGSYLRPAHYAIHVLEIDSSDDYLLTVNDTILDEVSGTIGPRKSRGAMTFVEGRPQILVHGLENKRGLSLMLGNTPEADEQGRLSSIVGTLMALNKHHAIGYRRFLMLRETSLTVEAMIAQSGIFTRDQLDASGREQHLAAFKKLATITTNETFPDPILTFDGPRSTCIFEPKCRERKP
jgi:hypothetical protein